MKKNGDGPYSNRLRLILPWVLLMGLALDGCEGSRGIHEATKTWEMYIQSIKAGNTELARNFWTKESQNYFDFESERERFWLDQKLTVVKANYSDGVVRLQLLAERDGQQKGFFSYLIRQNGKYLLQYPFLIFAQSWPTMRSQHFIFHSMSLPDSAYSEMGNEAAFPDTTILEEFLARIQRLTGAQYPGTIDYYLCQDRKEAAQLAGLREGFPRFDIGSCAVTMEKYSFAVITRIVTKGIVKPIDLIYYGLLGYSELERSKMEKGGIDGANYTTAEYIKKLGKHPLLSLAKNHGMRNDREREANLWIIGGALVDLLIIEGGDERFRELYKSADTEQSFENAIAAIYGTDLETLEKKLQEKYKPILEKTKAKQGGK